MLIILHITKICDILGEEELFSQKCTELLLYLFNLSRNYHFFYIHYNTIFMISWYFSSPSITLKFIKLRWLNVVLINVKLEIIDVEPS